MTNGNGFKELEFRKEIYKSDIMIKIFVVFILIYLVKYIEE